MKFKWLGNLFVANRGLKLVSLLIALALWVRVVGFENSQEQYKAVLELVNLPKELVLVGTIPDSVSVRLLGPRAVMAGIDKEALRVTVDLTGMREGLAAYEVLPARMSLPRGVAVTQLSPSTIALQADRKIKKRLPVVPRLLGPPAEGFSISGVAVDPPSVEVEGPEKLFKGVREIPTEVVEVAGLAGSLERSVLLSPSDPAFRPVSGNSVTLTVKVKELTGERSYVGVAVKTPGPDHSVRPQAVEVRLGGNLSVLSKIAAKDIEVRASVPQKGRAVSPLLVTAPPQTRFLSVTPSEVAVRSPKPEARGAEPAAGGEPKDQNTQDEE